MKMSLIITLDWGGHIAGPRKITFTSGYRVVKNGELVMCSVLLINRLVASSIPVSSIKFFCLSITKTKKLRKKGSEHLP